jgi:hypothetical protein
MGGSSAWVRLTRSAGSNYFIPSESNYFILSEAKDLARQPFDLGLEDPLAALGAASSVAEPALSVAEGLRMR